MNELERILLFVEKKEKNYWVSSLELKSHFELNPGFRWGHLYPRTLLSTFLAEQGFHKMYNQKERDFYIKHPRHEPIPTSQEIKYMSMNIISAQNQKQNAVILQELDRKFLLKRDSLGSNLKYVIMWDIENVPISQYLLAANRIDVQSSLCAVVYGSGQTNLKPVPSFFIQEQARGILNQKSVKEAADTAINLRLKWLDSLVGQNVEFFIISHDTGYFEVANSLDRKVSCLCRVSMDSVFIVKKRKREYSDDLPKEKRK